jgi:hypothetical protein
MRLFRSEEHVRRAYDRPGAVFPAAQLWRLAQVWYGNRLDPAWEPRTRDGHQALLDDVGLSGDFWRLG